MSLTISVDLSEAEKLAADIRAAETTIGTAAAASLNRITEQVRTDSVRQIVSQVNLQPNYVDGKVEITQAATPAKAQSVISVADEPIFLTNYGAKQKQTANVWTQGKYQKYFGSTFALHRLPNSGKLAPWIPRTGDAKRGISLGQKAAGISATIHVGKTVTLRHVFMTEILSGKVFAGRWGSFQHTGKGQDTYKPLYGPSAYQVVRGVWRDSEADIVNLMDTEIVSDVIAGINRELIK